MGADRIVAGSSGVGFDSPGALVADRVSGLLGVVTAAGLVVGAARMANVPQQAALSAITTAQNLFTVSIPGGTLNLVGRTVRVRGTAVYSTTSTNVATITIALKLGAVTICTITTAATNTAASTNLPLQFEFNVTVVSVGTAGTVQAHGRVDINIGTAAAPNTASYLDTNTGVSSAIDLTAAQVLAVTIAASAAVPSAQLLSGSVDILS